MGKCEQLTTKTIVLGHRDRKHTASIMETMWLSIFEDLTQQTFVLMKTSSRRLQDVLIKTNIFAFLIRLRRRLQDVLVKTNIFVLDVCLQDVFQKRLRDIFKTSCKDVFQTFSRRIIKLKCSCKQVFETYSTHF